MEIAKLILEYIQALVWPVIVIFLVSNFKKEAISILSRLESAVLPGGIQVNLNNNIAEIKNLSNEVRETSEEKKKKHSDVPLIKISETNSRLLELGLMPSPSGLDMQYYHDLAQENPNLALAGLRMDIEILIKNLATGFRIEINKMRANTHGILKELLDKECLFESQYNLATKILHICNQAIHGAPITTDQSELVIFSAETLIEDYIAWLSWGFDERNNPIGYI